MSTVIPPEVMLACQPHVVLAPDLSDTESRSGLSDGLAAELDLAVDDNDYSDQVRAMEADASIIQNLSTRIVNASTIAATIDISDNSSDDGFEADTENIPIRQHKRRRYRNKTTDPRIVKRRHSEIVAEVLQIDAATYRQYRRFKLPKLVYYLQIFTM